MLSENSDVILSPFYGIFADVVVLTCVVSNSINFNPASGKETVNLSALSTLYCCANVVIPNECFSLAGGKFRLFTASITTTRGSSDTDMCLGVRQLAHETRPDLALCVGLWRSCPV